MHGSNETMNHPEKQLGWGKRRGLVPVAIGAIFTVTLGTMVFLGSSNPPIPEIGISWLGMVRADVIGHLLLFGALGFLVTSVTAYVVPSKGPVFSLAAAVIAMSVWGAFTEWYQTLVPSRSGSLEDLAADVIGASLGAFGFLALRALGVSRIERFQSAPRKSKTVTMLR